ncbi:hypothetical protein V2J09_022659 [Rumex salicifolius]
MDSDLRQQQYSHHFQSKQQMNAGGGLTRYRSAPSSTFASFMDAADSVVGAGDLSQPYPQPRPLSPETESILARFMENVADGGADSTPGPHKLYDIPENSPLMPPPFIGSVKQETEQIQSFASNNNNIITTTTTTNNNNNNNNNNLSSSSRMNYQPNGNSVESNFRLPNSGVRMNPNLIRHRSSPAGLFDNIIIEDGILVNKETGNYGSGSRTSTNSQINFSSAETQMTAGNSAGSRRFSNGDDDSFMNGLPVSSWDDSAIFSGAESSGSGFNSPENQIREGRMNRPVGLLSHHLSLPKASIEKLLQFQESVPCKMRAKRGFATHPRSIAERVRRTKISDRMRKLQDLVPNMDKQTNTSDMLDLAVDYIKELQKQVTTLTDKRDKCTCKSSIED